MRYHIIVNPVSGHGKAVEFVATHVVPLMQHLGVQYTAHRTTGERDAGRIGKEILEREKEDEVVVIIAGGDGTAHEMIEGVLDVVPLDMLGRWTLAVLPLGTANALFHSLFAPGSPLPTGILPDILSFLDSRGTSESDLHSLTSLLLALSKSEGNRRRLPITFTEITPSAEAMTPTTPIPSHIVLSTALHACLLETSETLRASHPGVERFALAAQHNVGVFHPARVTLLGRPGNILQWSSKHQRFDPPYTYDPKAGHVLTGPFAYFLSTTIASRLEETFTIAPTLIRAPPPPENATMDIIVMRPMRDPRVRRCLHETPGEEGMKRAIESWGRRAWEVLGWARKAGEHVDLLYPEQEYEGDGGAVFDGRGDVVVEVFRCEGFEWVPTDPQHKPSHTICADGSIHTIPPDGKATVKVGAVGTATTGGFWVWG